MGVRTLSLAAALLMSIGVAPAFAQQDEIIVTASRYVERNERVTLPAISIVRRADAVVSSVTVESDTRDLALRRSELEQTLRDLDRRVRAGGAVSVGLLEEGPDGDAGDTRVKPFTLAGALAQIRSGSRPDTSRVSILLRTAVRADDTLDTADTRLDQFIRSVSSPGRVTLIQGAVELSLLDPAQYRSAVIAAIIADGKVALGLAGDGQALRIEGLHNPIAWRRSGDLELRLYVPHTMAVVPGD